MTQTLIEFAIAGLSLLTVLKFAPRFFDFLRDERTRWLSLGLLVLIAGGLLGDTSRLTSAPAFKLMYTALFLASVLLALTGPARHLREAPSLRPLLMIIVFWAWLFGVNVFRNADLSSTSGLLMRVAPGLVWIALALVWRRSSISREMLATVAALAVSIPGLLLPLLGNTWRACDEHKCGVFGAMLTGAYNSENYLSQQIVIIAVLHLVTFGARASGHLLVLSAVWLLATESRTAQYAIALALAVAILAGIKHRMLKTPSTQRSRGAVVCTLIPLVFILAALQLARSASPDDFSGRGIIWLKALAQVEKSPFIGLGLDRWTRLQEMGVFSSHFPHSFYVLVFFSGGLVGLALLFLWVRESLVVSTRLIGSASSSLVLGVVFMTLGLLEVVWNPLAIDGTSWIPLVLLAVPGLGKEASSTITEDTAAPQVPVGLR